MVEADSKKIPFHVKTLTKTLKRKSKKKEMRLLSSISYLFCVTRDSHSVQHGTSHPARQIDSFALLCSALFCMVSTTGKGTLLHVAIEQYPFWEVFGSWWKWSADPGGRGEGGGRTDGPFVLDVMDLHYM